MNDVQLFVQKVLLGINEAPKGRYYPTLIVGLGGTGLGILRQLKSRLLESDVNKVRLLGIDADSSENEKYVPDLPQLNQSELAILDASLAIRYLERAAAGTPTDKFITDFLPNNYQNIHGLHADVKSRIDTQKGAGQMRRAGKLLFVSNVSDGAKLDGRIGEIRKELTGLVTTVSQIRNDLLIDHGVRIYVTGSIAGGTGAGCFLDCLALLRNHFSDAAHKITAALLLPGPLFDKMLSKPKEEMMQTRGNAVGSLTELQAFMTGDMAQHLFVFGGGKQFSLGINTLVNDVYLVDHTTYTGREAKDHMDLCRSVGNFLYAQVGTGVGAVMAAGRINAQPTIDQKAQKPPLVFSSFGVSVIEYPLHDLLTYSIRSTLKNWLERWRTDRAGVDLVESEVKNAIAQSRLNNTLIVSQLLPEIPEAKFSDGWKNDHFEQKDEDFFKKVTERREKFTEKLQKSQSILEQKTADFIGEVCSAIEARCKQWVAVSKSMAQEGIEDLSKHLAELSKQRLTDADKRKEDIIILDKVLTVGAKKINDRDLFSDTKLRKSYLENTEKRMKFEAQEHLDPLLASIHSKLQENIRDLLTRLSALDIQTATFIDNNNKALRDVENSPPSSCFIQQALPPSQYKQWIEKNLVKVTTCPVPRELHLISLIETAINPILDSYRKLIKDLDVKSAAQTDEDIKNGIVATDAASEPLIELISTAPHPGELAPQKIVAGLLSENDPFVNKHYSRSGSVSEIIVLQTGDKRRLLCVQTYSGFAAIHWKGFEDAERHYLSRPWRYGTLPTVAAVPPLRPPSGNRKEAFQFFGLGLVFELITCRGANYYKNFSFSEPIECHQYLNYKVDPNNGAKQLLAFDPAIIVRAERDKTKPQREFLLGISLEESLEAFCGPKHSEFLESVSDLVEKFKAHAGKDKTGEVIEHYIQEEITSLIDRAEEDSPRRKTLEAIRDSLRTYAKQLY